MSIAIRGLSKNFILFTEELYSTIKLGKQEFTR